MQSKESLLLIKHTQWDLVCMSASGTGDAGLACISFSIQPERPPFLFSSQNKSAIKCNVKHYTHLKTNF